MFTLTIKFHESFVSFDVVPLDALVELPVANRAEVRRMSIGLLQVVCSLLKALVPSTVS